MLPNNAGIFARKIVVGLLLVSFGIVIGRYTAIEAGKYPENKEAAINMQLLRAAETTVQKKLLQQDVKMTTHENAVLEVVSKEQVGVIDDKPCVVPIKDVDSRNTDVEDARQVVDSSGEIQPENTELNNDDQVLFDALNQALKNSDTTIKHNFDLQPRKDDWASEMENNIHTFFYYSTHAAEELPEEIVCKETLCQIAFLAKNHALCNMVINEMQAQGWWNFSQFQVSSPTIPNGDENLKCMVFVSM